MQALMLIDVQNAFLDSKWGKRNNLNAEQKMLRLLQHFRAKRQKIQNYIITAILQTPEEYSSKSDLKGVISLAIKEGEKYLK